MRVFSLTVRSSAYLSMDTFEMRQLCSVLTGLINDRSSRNSRMETATSSVPVPGAMTPLCGLVAEMR